MNDEERRRAAEEWNNWKPGSGKRKGYPLFSKPIPPVRDSAGRPIGKNGKVDWQRWADEIEESRKNAIHPNP